MAERDNDIDAISLQTIGLGGEAGCLVQKDHLAGVGKLFGVRRDVADDADFSAWKLMTIYDT